jgi:hypothetical protein
MAVLLKVHDTCIDGQDQVAKRGIEDALRDPGEPDTPREPEEDTPGEPEGDG